MVLLDTSAFILGYEGFDVEAEHYTVPAVQEELKRDGIQQLRFDTALQTGRLTMLKPRACYEAKVEAVSANLGEARVLSLADKELLALSLQLRAEGKSPVVVSDDYSIQNIADKLGLEYVGLATRGIRRRFDWIIYCPGCHRVFNGAYSECICPICGTTLKRKPAEKRPAEGRIRRTNNFFKP